jgi:hypothetical protein
MAQQKAVYRKITGAGSDFSKSSYAASLKEKFPDENPAYIESMASFMAEGKDVAERAIFKGPATYFLTVYRDQSYEIRDRRMQIRASGGPSSYNTEGFRRSLKAIGIEEYSEG